LHFEKKARPSCHLRMVLLSVRRDYYLCLAVHQACNARAFPIDLGSIGLSIGQINTID
jgi:hypothetical protein